MITPDPGEPKGHAAVWTDEEPAGGGAVRPGPGEPKGRAAVWTDERGDEGAGARREDGGSSGPAASEGQIGLRDAEFVVVDVETTGWQPGVAQITEIAAVRVSGGQVRETFSSLVDPGCPIPGPVAALTGITDALVAGAPPVADVLPRFLAFARGAVLTAHNAPFDVGFLSAACQASGLAWPGFTVLDTVGVARIMLSPGQVPDCKLATLAGYFGAAVPPRHRALADALATADVLAGLLGLLEAAGVTSVGEAIRLVGERAAAAAAAWADGAGRAGPTRWWRRCLRLLRRRRNPGPLPG